MGSSILEARIRIHLRRPWCPWICWRFESSSSHSTAMLIGEAAAAAEAAADKIRAVLAGNMATRMPPAEIEKLQTRLAGLEA